MNKILMYHSIGSPSSAEVGTRGYCVSEEKFRRQMEYIKAGTVPLITSNLACGDSPYKVTFDDGDISNYACAYPILKEFGMTAYFFVLVGKVGTEGYMSWKQIRELRDAGMVIGSHGMTHRILTELSDTELNYELRQSKKVLEENLGQRVDYFSIPRGFYNKRIMDKIKKAGYQAVFTSNPKDNDGFKFGRIPVRGNWSLEYFAKVLNNGLSFKDRAKEFVKDSSKRILGTKNYDRVRTNILKTRRDSPLSSA